jgi:hypothetical protein
MVSYFVPEALGLIVALLLADIPGIICGWIAFSNARKVLRKKTKDNFTDQMRTRARWGLLSAITGILIHTLVIGSIILAISILGI